MGIDEFFAAIEDANARIPGLHTLHPGADALAILRWQEARHLRLPDDLIAILRRSNGIGLKQDWFDGEPTFKEGAFRLYPLDEIGNASEEMYGRGYVETCVEMITWLAIGEGPDSSVFFVFDTNQRVYLTVEPIVPNEAKCLGPTIDRLLDFLDPINPNWSV